MMVKSKKATKSGSRLRSKAERALNGNQTSPFANSQRGRSARGRDDKDEFLSLRDAARYTDQYRDQRRNTSLQLRNQAIGFVRSSELPKGTIEEETTVRQTGNKSSIMSPTELIHDNEKIERHASPSPSNSSAEIVVFTGRAKQQAGSVTYPRSPPANIDSKLQSVADGTSIEAIPLQSSDPNFKLAAADTIGDEVRQDCKYSHRQSKRGRRPLNYSAPSTKSDSDSDGSLVDYMENMRAHGELDDDFVLQAQDFDTDLDGWGPSELADFDDLSTSDEASVQVDLVLSKRRRPSGLQYLVVGQGQSVDEARWLHHESASLTDAKEAIKQFEELVQSQDALNSDSDEDDKSYSSMQDESLQSEGIEESGDGKSLEDRHIMRMSDEKIARLLSKQEELGMGSDELILFDDPGHNSDSIDDLAGFVPFHAGDHHQKARKNGKYKKRKPHDPFLGSAQDMLDDEYGEFDIMDFQRPSLNRKSQSEQDISFGLSDSELETELRVQFAADRKKKSAKKEERAELRAQGLLGKKNKFKPDLSARYNNGLTMSEFKIELEQFLFSENETLGLPPMSKFERKIIHEIASQFNLKSKSSGSGKSRFPILYKTSRTIEFNATLFQRSERKFQGRFLPRMDKRGKGRTSNSTRRSGGGGITSGTGYAEGETVGASAPELSSDNRGRAMLEKMGWSTGMGLGASDNKGILQPISHVVKKTRAGLG